MVWFEGSMKVIDLFVSLMKTSSENRRRVFKEEIDPIFIELSEVHKDYLQTFDVILELLRHRPQPVGTVIDLITDKKTKLEHVRVKISALAQTYTLEEYEFDFPDGVKQFFEAVLAYFQSASGQVRGYRGRLTDLLEFLDERFFETKRVGKFDAISMVYKYRSESGDLVDDDVGYKLFEVIEDVKERWNELTLAYAHAKVKLTR